MNVSDYMARKPTSDKKIDTVKRLMNELEPSQQEDFRNQLLSWLLFDGTQHEEHGPETSLQGLSDEEKALIIKLARQTEALHRLKKDDPEDANDQ